MIISYSTVKKMPYKDKQKRYDAIRRSVAKKPDHYKALGLENKRKAHRRGYQIKRRYGLSYDDWQAMLKRQNGHCKICDKKMGLTKAGNTNLHVDHCHTTGKVRGLLCARCNMLIGFMEQPDWLKRSWEAERYLEDNS